MKELVNIDGHLMQANIYGAIVYCTLMGECFVESVNINDCFRARLVQTRESKKCIECDEYGRPAGDIDAECCVFPSRDNRDWSTFDATPRYDISELKPFDKVLVRCTDGTFVHKTWLPNFYSKYNSDERLHQCLFGNFNECVPYNDETKHLLGTTDEAPNFYRTWKS
mgnify:CR=1 FL=1